MIADWLEKNEGKLFANLFTLLAGVLALGMFLAPYSDLPARVSQLERSNDELRREMREQSQRLQLVVCFLETEANGGNPLSCSR